MLLLVWHFVTVLALDSAVVQGPFATREACQEASAWILQHAGVMDVSEPYSKTEGE